MIVVIKNISWVEPMHQTSQTEVDSTMPATDETRKILPIFLVVLIDVLGLMIILPLLPFYSEQFGATPFVVGMLISSYALCQLVSAPLLGRWSDHVGRKPLLIVSQVGTCLGFLLLAFANSLPLIFLSRIIDGLTAGNLSLAQAYISDVTRPEKRAAAFGKIGTAFGIGFFLGPSLTAFLYQFGPKAPILAAAFLSFCSIVCTATLLPGGKVGAAAQAAPQARPKGPFAFGIYSKYFVSPRLRSLLVQIFIFYFTFSAYISRNSVTPA
jgi:MFS transporter, DHA1 family, tetracycline resistance protein